MASAMSNRANGKAARRTPLEDFSTSGRLNESEKRPQISILSQNIGNGTLNWQSGSEIWRTKPKPIGSSFANVKKEFSRSRDEDDISGAKGSGALTASSEAEPWNGSRQWSTETSPTLMHPTTARTDINIPAYVPVTYPTAIGQGPRTSLAARTQPVQGSLNPASATLKNSPPYAPFAIDAPKEASGMHSALDMRQSPGAVPLDSRSGKNANFLGLGSREKSLPPSRQSDSGLSVASHNSRFGNNFSSSYANYSHTPNDSMSLHRPSFPTTAQTFPPQTTKSSYQSLPFTSAAQAELNQNLARFSFSGKTTANESAHHQASADHNLSFPQHGSYYDFQPLPQNGMYGSITDGHKAEYLEQPFANQYAGSIPVARPCERGPNTPAGNDYQRGIFTPYYPTNDILRLDAMGPCSPGSRNLRVQLNGDSAISNVDRKPRRLQVSQPQPYYQYAPHFQNQHPAHAFDHPTPNFPSISRYRFDLSVAPYPSAPRGPARDQDLGRGIRSPLLEEFRNSTKTNRHYELKDIYNHIVEFSGDQHGSRFIQQRLENANSDEKEQIFLEIQPNALQLMTDVFGNYVVQKLFEHGNQVQKTILAERMKNHVIELSLQMYGCRVVQKALEFVLTDQQVELVKELRPEVLKCVKDQNGNHVIQKAIERVPTDDTQFIIEAFRGQVITLAAHPYGCRVIQRMLEFSSAENKAAVLEELHQGVQFLITDQYGNYVTQHVLERGEAEDRAKIIAVITSNLVTFSKHKFASNVVEKSVIFGTDQQRSAIVSELTRDKNGPLQAMIKDQYGNYVIQKLLAQLKGAERAQFVDGIKPQLLYLKKFNFGKQIAAIEKLIFSGLQAPTQPSAMATK